MSAGSSAAQNTEKSVNAPLGGRDLQVSVGIYEQVEIA